MRTEKLPIYKEYTEEIIATYPLNVKEATRKILNKYNITNEQLENDIISLVLQYQLSDTYQIKKGK